MCSDEVFIQGVKAHIAGEHMHADYAVDAELARLKELLKHTGNAYLSERTQDLDDLGRRLQKHLSRMESGTDALLSTLPPQTILVAHQLFPMVVDAGDLAQAVELVHRMAEEEQVEVMPQLGAMIETPAAVFQIDRLVALVDFVSIGTNDLTQFILAADRDSAQTMARYSTLHPAVLRAVHRILEEAQGRACSICGEAAGDPRAACLFLGLGVRALSMSLVLAPKVRQHISRQRLVDLEDAARQALQCSSAREVEDLVAALP